jgi:hypothetical protein
MAKLRILFEYSKFFIFLAYISFVFSIYLAFFCHLTSFPSPLWHEEVAAKLPDCGENTFDTNHR